MKALLRVSVFVVEKKSEWLHLCYCSASSSDAYPPVTLWHLETHRDSLSRRRKRTDRSGAGGSLLEASKIPERCRVFYVIMRTRSSLTLVTFTGITLCPFVHLYVSFFCCSFFCVWTFVVLFTRLQPVHWWSNSIPCWLKREHLTQKQMSEEKSSSSAVHHYFGKDNNEMFLKTPDYEYERVK